MSMLELSIMMDNLEENQEKEEKEFREYHSKLVEEMEIKSNEIELEDEND